MKGLFVVIDGVDGAGLGTQVQMLVQWLNKKLKKVVVTKEPSNGLLGGIIKAALRHEWKTDARTLQLLFTADRAHHVQKVILPALREGATVVCDRYILSTYCYGMADGLKLEWLRSLNEEFPKPTITIILDVPPSVSLERIKRSRIGVELFEETKKLQRVRENYHRLRNEFPNTFIVDGTKSIQEVHKEIKKIVQRFLKG